MRTPEAEAAMRWACLEFPDHLEGCDCDGVDDGCSPKAAKMLASYALRLEAALKEAQGERDAQRARFARAIAAEKYGGPGTITTIFGVPLESIVRFLDDITEKGERRGDEVLAALAAAESLAAERGREIERLRGSMMRYPKGSIVPEWTHYCADEHEPVASLGKYCPVCHTDAEGNKSPALSTPPKEPK